jgi:hypothetical protein
VQARQSAPPLYRHDHAVLAHEDGQRRVGRQGLQSGRRAVGETDFDPVGVLACAGLPMDSAAWCCAADPHEDEALPLSELHEVGA